MKRSSRTWWLTDSAWWRDVLDRSWRQGYQVLIPVFALAIHGSVHGVDWTASITSVIVAFLVVLVRAITGIRVESNEPLNRQIVDRALAAAAATILAMVTADGFNLLSADWGTILVAAVGSMGLALGSTFITPPPPVLVGDPNPLPAENGL